MRIIEPSQVTVTASDTVFRHSSRRPLIAMLLLLAGAAGVFAAGYRGMLPALIVVLAGGSLLVLALMAGSMYRKAAAPGSWLMASDQRRLLLNARSHLNTRFPRDTPHIVELRWDEVVAIRACILDVRGQDASRAVQRHSMDYLELVVGASTELAELTRLLARERSLRANGSAYRHYPVSVVDERVIRIEWRTPHLTVVPPVREAVELLERRAPVQPEARDRVELGGVGRSLDADVARRQVRELAEQGHLMEAMVLARRAFGWSTTEARTYIEGLLRPGSTDSPS